MQVVPQLSGSDPEARVPLQQPLLPSAASVLSSRGRLRSHATDQGDDNG